MSNDVESLGGMEAILNKNLQDINNVARSNTMHMKNNRLSAPLGGV